MKHTAKVQQRGKAESIVISGSGFAAFHSSQHSGVQAPEDLAGPALAQWEKTLARGNQTGQRLLEIGQSHIRRVDVQQTTQQAKGYALMRCLPTCLRCADQVR